MKRALAIGVLGLVLVACEPSIVVERGEKVTRCETLNVEGPTAICDGVRIDDWTRINCSEGTCVYRSADGVQIDIWKAYK